jgi:hypothetical protein
MKSNCQYLWIKIFSMASGWAASAATSSGRSTSVPSTNVADLTGSGELAADKPARPAAAAARCLPHTLESVRLEQADGADISAGLIDAVASWLYRVTLNHDRPAGARVLNCAIEQVVHQSPAPESRANHETDRRPSACVISMRNGPRVDQGAIGGLRRDRAPAGDLPVNESEDARARLAVTQPAHMRDPARHGEAGVAVGHARAPTATRLARHHQRREVIPPPDGRQHLNPHIARITTGKGPATLPVIAQFDGGSCAKAPCRVRALPSPRSGILPLTPSRRRASGMADARTGLIAQRGNAFRLPRVRRSPRCATRRRRARQRPKTLARYDGYRPAQHRRDQLQRRTHLAGQRRPAASLVTHPRNRKDNPK